VKQLKGQWIRWEIEFEMKLDLKRSLCWQLQFACIRTKVSLSDLTPTAYTPSNTPSNIYNRNIGFYYCELFKLIHVLQKLTHQMFFLALCCAGNATIFATLSQHNIKPPTQPSTNGQLTH